jgi:hypothetical protein
VAWSAWSNLRIGRSLRVLSLDAEGVGVVPVYLNFQRGTEEEFSAALNAA